MAVIASSRRHPTIEPASSNGMQDVFLRAIAFAISVLHCASTCPP
jgi:hypothetical protein